MPPVNPAEVECARLGRLVEELIEINTIQQATIRQLKEENDGYSNRLRDQGDEIQALKANIDRLQRSNEVLEERNKIISVRITLFQ